MATRSDEAQDPEGPAVTAASGGPDGPSEPTAFDELGAHVSSAGGVENAPGRAREIESVRLQLFTKQPSRWAEPTVEVDQAAVFRREREERKIRTAVSHDSYLINLSSPNEALWKRSYASFEGELRRCAALGVELVVTHPGNATDGDAASGLARNAEGVTRALEAVPDGPMVLLELTAGSGTSVGATFENLAVIRNGVPPELRDRIGICVDTCHAYSAGYDLVGDYEGVWASFDDVLGLECLRLFHLNDSRNPFDSRKDRHEHLGRGSLGEEPFRRIMTDERFTRIPKLLETPKEDDPVANDLRNLELLRSFRREAPER